MNSLQTEFWGLTSGLIISSVGFISIIIALFRIRSRDFTLLTFGLFSYIYGIRWISGTLTMKTLVGFPFTLPYFNNFLTYFLVILLSLFFLNIIGSGIYSSMKWVFWSTVVYALVKIPLDFLLHIPPEKLPIIPLVVIIWCIVWVVNLLTAREKPKIELWIIRIVSSIAVICIVHDQIIHMIVVPWNFHLEHFGFLTFFSGMAGVTTIHFFSNEKRLIDIEKEVEIARRIQQSNLPVGLTTPVGIDLAARYEPMSAVAGDFYDIHVDNNKNVGILIADVSGHGVGAALIGSMLKIALASQISFLSDPAKVLTEINRILQGKMEDSFITACYVYIDLQNNKFVYSNAGHPGPQLFRKSGEPSYEFSIGGTIIGPFPESVYQNGSLDLVNGDRLVLYTDGLTEAKNIEGDFFAEDRLKENIVMHLNEVPTIAANQLLDSLFKWTGKSHNKFEDDLTLIIVDINKLNFS